jgi:hypothetical protein
LWNKLNKVIVRIILLYVKLFILMLCIYVLRCIPYDDSILHILKT